MTKQIIEFIQNHWLLCSAGAAVVALIIIEELREKMGGTPKLSPQNAAILLNRDNTTIIDTRDSKAFAEGYILGSANIARSDLDQHIPKLADNKEQTIILVDSNEASLAPFAAKLRTEGFTKVYILAGGINAWKTAQLPLHKD